MPIRAPSDRPAVTAPQRRDGHLERFRAATRAMGHLPQYRHVARPVNRLLGGPTQPLTSAFGTAYVTDIVTHQMVPLFAIAVAHGDIGLLRPWAPVSTAALWTFGLPAAQVKRARFAHELTMQAVATAASPDDAALARALATRASALLQQHPKEPLTAAQFRDFARFAESAQGALSGGIQKFAILLRAGDASTRADAQALCQAASTYHRTHSDADFAALVETLRRCAMLPAVRENPQLHRALLARDALKASLLGALLCLQWVGLAMRLYEGDPTAQQELVWGTLMGAAVVCATRAEARG